MQTLKVHEDIILSAPWLPLPNDDSNLLTEIRFTHNRVTNTCRWQTVKTTLDTLYGDDVKVLGSSVVSATVAATGRPSDILNLFPEVPTLPIKQQT